MLITNVTGNFFLKQNDTATQMRLRISEVDGTPVDLSLASRVEVVIGINEGRVLVKTPTILSELGELEFGLDEGDVLPVGDDLLEVHIYNDALEKRVAPSKGYYKLKVQKPIDELQVEVTTYTLDYFIGEVNRITNGLPELVVRAEDLADRLDVILVDSEAALEQSTTTLANANEALSEANAAVANTTSAIQAATDASILANVAATGATNAATSANTASQSAANAAGIANTAAAGASSATDAANLAASVANAAANLAEGISDDLLGYNIAITDFSLGTTYIKHQPARFNGSTFRAKVETIGNPLPVAPERENTWWTLVAQRGVDGTGAVGSVNGIQPGTDGNVDLGNLTADWANITSKPTTFAPSAHTHTPAQVSGLPEFMQDVDTHVSNTSNPHNTTKVQVGLGSVENLGLATQAEAEAGTSAAKYMTPQRTSQAIVKGLEPLQQQVTTHLDQIEWFDAVLINGFGGRVRYGKNAHGTVFVQVSALNSIPTNAVGTVICTLPQGYRPNGSIPVGTILTNVDPYTSEFSLSINTVGSITLAYGNTLPPSAASAGLRGEVIYYASN